MDEMDVTQTPYAEFLETLVRGVVENRPEKIAVVGVMPDGEVFTGAYGSYGDCGPYDLMQMASHLIADAVLDIVKANAKDIVRAAEEQE